jgi:hypothetical protein
MFKNALTIIGGLVVFVVACQEFNLIKPDSHGFVAAAYHTIQRQISANVVQCDSVKNN